jgi:hypothetical protein
MKTVLVETWNPPGLCRGHAEIRYARNDCGWIEVHKALGEYGDLGDIGDVVAAMPPGPASRHWPKYPISSVKKFEVRSDTVHRVLLRHTDDE